LKTLLLATSLSLLQSAGATADAAAIQQFQAEIAKYMEMRDGLLNEIPAPRPNSSATDLVRASDTLAAAIRRRRPDATPGLLFTPAVADAFKRRVSETIRAAHLEPVLTGIDDEGVGLDQPAVYLRFPDGVQLATMPPSLLAALPRLPKELEYRIVGSYLVLRDVDAALVLDFIPAAVPRK
jgi:hypothetical protein